MRAHAGENTRASELHAQGAHGVHANSQWRRRQGNWQKAGRGDACDSSGRRDTLRRRGRGGQMHIDLYAYQCELTATLPTSPLLYTEDPLMANP